MVRCDVCVRERGREEECVFVCVRERLCVCERESVCAATAGCTGVGRHEERAQPLLAARLEEEEEESLPTAPCQQPTASGPSTIARRGNTRACNQLRVAAVQPTWHI